MSYVWVLSVILISDGFLKAIEVWRRWRGFFWWVEGLLSDVYSRKCVVDVFTLDEVLLTLITGRLS